MSYLTIDTLGVLKAQGYAVTAYCESRPDCRHSEGLDLDALINRLGDDFVAIGDPNPLSARLRCTKCGGRHVSIRLGAPNGYRT